MRIAILHQSPTVQAAPNFGRVVFWDTTMVTVIVLLTSFTILRVAGFLGVTALDNWCLPLRIALFLMFLVTASAVRGAMQLLFIGASQIFNREIRDGVPLKGFGNPPEHN
jgi:hypothetical protein